MCVLFEDKLKGMRNFHRAYIEGSTNLRTSSFIDHAKTDMHQRAMLLLKKGASTDVREYAPIAKSLLSMDEAAKTVIKRKFDIAYFLAKEEVAFRKMKPLCLLEERHGVKLGDNYKNDLACSAFTDFIGQELHENLRDEIHKANFFSLQLDGSTDSGNVEEELFLVVYFDPYSSLGRVQARNVYFCTQQPSSVDAAGLYRCLNSALTYLDIDRPSRLIGIGCDGASVNMGDYALKGLVKADWIVFVWCLAHRLELALKDALKATYFSTLEEMLMRMYYLYAKAPKKFRELEEVISSLARCLDLSEFSKSGGKRPIRACGTRFISHKVAALEQIIDKFGAYMSHLATLVEDSSTKPADKQKLRAYYVKKWAESKVLLGCATFHDILKPIAMLCEALQREQVCLVSAIEAVLKSSNALDKLKTKQVTEFPSVQKVLLRIKSVEEGKTYQLTFYERGLAFFRDHYLGYINTVQVCIHERIKPRDNPDSDMLNHAIKVLATHGWEKSEDSSFAHESINFVL